jgi:hypothetical protein
MFKRKPERASNDSRTILAATTTKQNVLPLRVKTQNYDPVRSHRAGFGISTSPAQMALSYNNSGNGGQAEPKTAQSENNWNIFHNGPYRYEKLIRSI